MFDSYNLFTPSIPKYKEENISFVPITFGLMYGYLGKNYNSDTSLDKLDKEIKKDLSKL